MFDLTCEGLGDVKSIHHNLSKAQLIEQSIIRKEGLISCNGALTVKTGKYTGRSPNDKFILKDDNTANSVWWGSVNKAINIETVRNLRDKMLSYLKDKDLFVYDCFACACEKSRLSIRVITEKAWHSCFASNIFINPTSDELEKFSPDFVIIHAPDFKAEPIKDGTNSEVAIFIDFTNREILICGTQYAGEIKKAIFTVLNYLLPFKGTLSMHCSANTSKSKDTALFFGLSGTGKTTLSADPSRFLIGDDEHGWSDEGIFNFEGGCYAKVIKLNQESEPYIFLRTRDFGTILENVVIDPNSRIIDFNDDSLTENTRASYNIANPSNGNLSVHEHPKNIIMLTCDAFGVLPPVAKLTQFQAVYHFLSGYTAKIAGTERGIKEPTAVFSACFGAPFMARHPITYAKLLSEKIIKHNVQCWLVNTGWTGGPYGTGSRIKIAWTRAILDSILSGDFHGSRFNLDPIFKFDVPLAVKNAPKSFLDAKETWSNRCDYNRKAKYLANLFKDNFRSYIDFVGDEVKKSQPNVD